MLWKTKTTKKLYFNQWLHKITLSSPSLSYVKRMKISSIETLDTVDNGRFYGMGRRSGAVHNKQNILKVAYFLEDCTTKYEFQTRAEGDNLSVFTNDLNLIDHIEKNLSRFVIDVYSPENDEIALFLSSNKNKVICNEFPNGKHKYKVYLGDKEKIPQNVRDGFLSWTKNYDDDKIYTPSNTVNVLSNTSKHWYSFGSYFYVSDSKMLSMALMFMGPYVSKTEEYVLKTDIN